MPPRPLLRALDISAREVADRRHPRQRAAGHRGHNERQVTASVKEILGDDREDGNYGRTTGRETMAREAVCRDAVRNEAKGIDLFSLPDGNIGRKRWDVGFFHHGRIDVVMTRRDGITIVEVIK
jgi:hypothetical protein